MTEITTTPAVARGYVDAVTANAFATVGSLFADDID